jgi:hypothetical protein
MLGPQRPAKVGEKRPMGSKVLVRPETKNMISFSEGGNSNRQQTCSFCRQECPRQESNLDLPLRRRSSYPLDYEGSRIRLASLGTTRMWCCRVECGVAVSQPSVAS